MAASLITCFASSAAWCFCTACTSLLGSCCGNDKPSTLAPSITSGRKRSVLLLVLSIALALAFQYAVAPAIVNSSTLSMLPYLYDAWMEGCDYNYDKDDQASDAQSQSLDLTLACVGNNAVYRPMLAATLFFLLAAVAAYCKPTANREAWPAKFILYLFGVAAMVFVPNTPLFDAIYLNMARIGGVVFIFVQQLVIIDVAYNWNDSWVEKANQAERDEGPGGSGGKRWLAAILVSCITLFALALGGLIYLFINFTGCPTNDAFLSVTLILCVLITAAQLLSTTGDASLLSSACISAWAVYLLYTAVTKNPDAACNPMLGMPTVANIVLGLVASIISLGYTGWSYTAEDKLSRNPSNTTTTSDHDHPVDEAPTTPYQKSSPETGTKKVTGVVVDATNTDDDEENHHGENINNDNDNPSSQEQQSSNSSWTWRLNIALAAICCWTAVILTHWGSVASQGSVANPSAGSVAMWMVIASQWIVLVLYLWTLVAPTLFPDRDFS